MGIRAWYWLLFVPLAYLAVVWLWGKSTVRGVAAVVITRELVVLLAWSVSEMYTLGVSTPVFVQTMAVFWPQRTFFGPALVWLDSNGPVWSEPVAYLVTYVFWALAALLLGTLTRRAKSFAIVQCWAVVFVAGLVHAVEWVVPLLKMRLVFESP